MAHCTHHECRCATASELAYMGALFDRTDLLVLALAAHGREVRCRKTLDGPEAHLPQPEVLVER